MIVTDHWLLEFGFGSPRRSNIDEIIKATVAQAYGGFLLHRPTERAVDPEGIISQTRFYT